MGWLWSSSSPTNSSNGEDDSTRTSNETPPAPSPFPSDVPPQDSSWTTPNSTSNSTTSPEPSASDAEPRTRDQIANDEVLSYFRTLEDERKIAVEEEEAAAFDDDEDDEDDEPPELMTPARIYDSKMKCRELLDAAWWCASPGGQFFHLYRFGTLRQCGQHWADMTTCWRINRSTFNEKKREQRTLQRQWQRERDRLRERGGCAEEVWGEGRRWVEKNAFKADWDGIDSPWRKANDN